MTPALPRNRLPGINLTIGIVASVLPIIARQLVPASSAFAPTFLLPCLFLSSVFLPLGTWLALRSLITESLAARQHLAQFLFGFKWGFLIIGLTFCARYFLDKLADEFKAPNYLPQVIVSAQTSPGAEKRVHLAASAYIGYGVVIAYPGPDNELTYFVPSQDDKVKRAQIEDLRVDSEKRIEFLHNLSSQANCLGFLYLVTYFTAFLVGGFILLIRSSEKQPRDSVLSTS